MEKAKVKKHWTIITSTILAIVWLLFSLSCFADVSRGIDSSNAGESIGTMIGMGIIAPYLVTALVGTVLHAVGTFTYKRGLYLSGVIVESVSILLMPAWGFGYILVIIFGYIGYAKMRKNPVLTPSNPESN